MSSYKGIVKLRYTSKSSDRQRRRAATAKFHHTSITGAISCLRDLRQEQGIDGEIPSTSPFGATISLANGGSDDVIAAIIPMMHYGWYLVVGFVYSVAMVCCCRRCRFSKSKNNA